MGTAPVISDGELVLAESGAIVDYIIARHGGGRLVLPPAHPDYAQYLYWFHFANSNLQALLHRYMIVRRLEPAPDNPTRLDPEARLGRALNMTDKRLGEVDYLAGKEFTAADIMIFFSLTTMRTFVSFEVAPYPNVLSYLRRIGQRKGYRRAMQKGDRREGAAALLTRMNPGTFPIEEIDGLSFLCFRILLFNEPTSALDPETIKEVSTMQSSLLQRCSQDAQRCRKICKAVRP